MPPKKLFWFLRHLEFCSDFFGHTGKQLDKKAKTGFKISNITNQDTNNYNVQIAHYLKK